MGSKSGIAEEIIKRLPNADHFYDLFGGGFSITHAMLARRPKDFKKFHFNEIRPGICELIQSAIRGEYSYNNFKPSFVDRETFFLRKDQDPYIKLCWSFGNQGATYMFSKEIEPYKKSMHNAIVLNEFDQLACQVFGMSAFSSGYSIKTKRFFLRNKIEHFRKTKIPDFLVPFLKSEQSKMLERLQQLERLTFTNLSYDKVKIESNSIIYCDPPYANTEKYDHEINHKQFLDWANSQASPVFISEYQINDSRFVPIFKIEKLNRMNALNRTKKTEIIYANKAAVKSIRARLMKTKVV